MPYFRAARPCRERKELRTLQGAMKQSYPKLASRLLYRQMSFSSTCVLYNLRIGGKCSATDDLWLHKNIQLVITVETAKG
jgi:hypothetical protein